MGQVYKTTTKIQSLARGGVSLPADSYVTEISFHPDTWSALLREGAIIDVNQKAETAVKDNSEVDATATAIELANEHGLQLWSVKGSGKAGRITINDVRALIEVDNA